MRGGAWFLLRRTEGAGKGGGQTLGGGQTAPWRATALMGVKLPPKLMGIGSWTLLRRASAASAPRARMRSKRASSRTRIAWRVGDEGIGSRSEVA